MRARAGQAPWLVGLVLALAVAGCTTPEGTTPPQDAEGRYVVTLGNSTAFNPAVAKVPVGATVVWTNQGTLLHDVSGYVGDPPKEDRPDFHTGYGIHLAQGESFQHTFDRKGTWTVWCHTHHEEGMKALLHVV